MSVVSHFPAVEDPTRLAALWQLQILDSPSEPAYDRLTRLVGSVLAAPVALVSLVDRDRQFFKSCYSTSDQWPDTRETPLSHSFCAHVVDTGEPLIITDARRHPLVRNNPVIQELGVIAYAGIPLIDRDGNALGSLCAIDHQPRTWTESDIAILRDLAAAVMTEIELRATTQAAKVQANALQAQADLLDLAHDGIMVLGFDNCRIQFWNRGATRMYGWSDDEAIGRASFDLLRTRFPQPLEEIKAVCVEAGFWDGELVHTRRDGTPVVVASRWALRRDAAGRPEAILEINNDITGRKQAEAALQIARDRLHERTRALEEKTREQEAFLYTVSHDLRAPLVSIQGMAGILLDDYADDLPDEARTCLQRIDVNAGKMQGLIGDLLDLARIDRVETDHTSVDLARVVHDVCAQLGHAMSARGARIHGVDDLPTVWANRAQMAQLFSNLIDNAVAYTPTARNPVVTLGATEREHGWEITVSDNGVGVPPEWRERIFGLFQRLPDGKALNPRGSGAGLAIVARIVETHGGRVWVESADGAGTTFVLTLPKPSRASVDRTSLGEQLANGMQPRMEATAR